MTRLALLLSTCACMAAPLGCGTEDEETNCIYPGQYSCTYSLTQSNCPAGTVKQSWTADLAIVKESCGPYNAEDTFTQAPCSFSCEVDFVPPYKLNGFGGTGGCGVACGTAPACAYLYTLYCNLK